MLDRISSFVYDIGKHDGMHQNNIERYEDLIQIDLEVISVDVWGTQDNFVHFEAFSFVRGRGENFDLTLVPWESL